MSTKETTPLLHKDLPSQNKPVPHTTLNENKKPYVGLTVEEVLLTSKEPLWIAIRIATFVTFWIMILIMLTTSIVIMIRTPGCVGGNMNNTLNNSMTHNNQSL